MSENESFKERVGRTVIQCAKDYMFLSFFATSSIGIWSSRQRVNNRYKLMVLITLLYSVLAPVSSVIGAYLSPDRLEAVIIARVLAQFVISVPFAYSLSMAVIVFVGASIFLFNLGFLINSNPILQMERIR